MIEELRENNPRGMRRYLTDVGDEAALAEWDTSRMKDSSK